MKDIQLYLASGSPRRQEMLESVGLCYKVVVPNIDETQLFNEVAINYVERMAVEKAQAAKRLIHEQLSEKHDAELPILAADTIVVQDNIIFGKPGNEQQAYKMWQGLSGNEHIVYTAMALIFGEEVFIEISETTVCFKEISKQEMVKYWATGEPQDKAGGYAIQGLGSAWVKQIYGSYSGVVGLPLYELRKLLLKVGIDWL